MPLDHIALYVPKARLDEMVTWLTAAGEPLGFKEFARPMPQLVAMGEEKPWFWLSGDDKLNDVTNNTWPHPHMGFVAKDPETVGKWYEAAIKAGGTDNGKPGPRPMFGPSYYAAFVKDPVLDINFEAVCKTWSPPETEETTNGETEKEAAPAEEKVDEPKETGPATKAIEETAAEEAEQPAKKRARRAT